MGTMACGRKSCRHIPISHSPTVTPLAFGKCRVWHPTNPPCHTDIDICEEGSVPILFSLPQMRNIGLEIALSPDSVLLTCEAFGYKKTPAVMASSQHIVTV